MTNWRAASILLCVLMLSGASAQQALVSSSPPASVGLSLRGNVLTLNAQVVAATTLNVYCPIVPGLLSFSGLTAPVQASYDQRTRMLQLALPPGTYRIVIRSLP